MIRSGGDEGNRVLGLDEKLIQSEGGLIFAVYNLES